MNQGSDSKTAVACLLTGPPGSGKTTAVKQAVARSGVAAGGFYTSEIREHGTRKGFRIETTDGDTAVLAHVDIRSRNRVGKYGVDLASLKNVAVPAITNALGDADVVVVDEIGKMELLSSSFRSAVEEVLASGKPLMGTIMLAPNPWSDALKRREDIQVIRVDRQTRDSGLDEAVRWLTRCIRARSSIDEKGRW